jgi:hypothetical protein
MEHEGRSQTPDPYEPGIDPNPTDPPEPPPITEPDQPDPYPVTDPIPGEPRPVRTPPEPIPEYPPDITYRSDP